VRINAQLIDASQGNHIWAESYDRQIGGIFEVQDRIIQRIVSALAARMNAQEREELGRPQTKSPEAYDSFLLGRQRFFRYANKDENRKARELFTKAVEFDPDFAMAYAMLAWTHAFDAMNGWSQAREQSLLRARELAAKALTLERALPLAYFVIGLSHRETGEYVKALVEAEKAIRYDPNYANAHVLLATLLYYAGRPEEGLERIKKAILINPHHPYNYTFHLGQAYYILRRYNEAIEAFQRGLDSNPASDFDANKT
jgi:adenylate cyclase